MLMTVLLKSVKALGYVKTVASRKHKYRRGEAVIYRSMQDQRITVNQKSWKSKKESLKYCTYP